MKPIWGILVLVLFASANVSAASKSIVCRAEGKCLSKNGQGLIEATAKLSFVETKNTKGLRVLKNIEGFVSTQNGIDDESAYIGHFKIASLTENPKYNPRKYLNSSRFEKFDATDTEGSQEDGMWGNLILDKDTDQESFEAHYIVQAGDHFGGTLHLNCKIAK